MKRSWAKTSLGDVAQIGAGNSAPQGDNLFADGTYPFFRTSDAGRIRFGEIYESTDYLNNEGVKGLRMYPKGTILFPKSGASTFLNHRVMLGVDGFVSSHLATIVGDESKINRQFLLYFLSTVTSQSMIQDHAYPSLNLPVIAGIPVPLPPLPEQQRIVAILDEAFEGISTATANAEKNLSNARELFDSTLQAVFIDQAKGWGRHTLKDMSLTFGRGKSKHRPRNDPKLYGGKYPFIQTGDIRNSNHFVTQYTQTYNEAGLAQSKLWAKGTLCITIAANIAETGILGFDSCFPDSVIGFVADPAKSEVHFVGYLLTSFKTMLQAKGKGSAQDNINLATFENERFPFPSLKEQKVVVARLDKLRAETQRLEAIYQQKLDALAELKKSILNQAFTGQLH